MHHFCFFFFLSVSFCLFALLINMPGNFLLNGRIYVQNIEALGWCLLLFKTFFCLEDVRVSIQQSLGSDIFTNSLFVLCPHSNCVAHIPVSPRSFAVPIHPLPLCPPKPPNAEFPLLLIGISASSHSVFLKGKAKVRRGLELVKKV